jgi:trk system potassium uptake protein TrkA
MQVLIIGAGEVGFHTALRLSAEGHQVVVMDRNPEALRKVNEQMDVQTLAGSGSSPSLLSRAEVNQADLLIAVTNSDEVNLAACRFARILAPKSTRIARIRNQDILSFIEQNGSEILDLDTVINPEREVAHQMVRFIDVPAASSVADFANGHVKLLGLKVPVTSPLVGKDLATVRQEGGVRFLIAAIEREDSVLIPRGDDVVLGDDLAYVVVREEDISGVVDYFGLQASPVRNLVIVGGGIIGTYLAKEAEERGIKTRVIEKNAQRCDALVEELSSAIVLNGDGGDLTLLEEENAGAADVFAAVTDHEEDNVLIALLGRKMGAKRTIARVAHLGYVPLVSNLGLDLVLSPRFAAVSAILRYLRRGKVLNIASLRGDGAEVIEVEAMSGSALVGKPLMKVKVPSGALLAAVIREGAVLIPGGDTVVQPGDHLIIFLLRKVLPKIEKLLTVSLDTV